MDLIQLSKIEITADTKARNWYLHGVPVECRV